MPDIKNTSLVVAPIFLSIILSVSCSIKATQEEQNKSNMELTGAEGEVKLMVLDPGHFHAALVQKTSYPQVNQEVHVYAPEGPELQAYLNSIESYNTRGENPANWKIKVHSSPDFLDKMIEEKPGNVMVTAGNNRLKTGYIKATADAGINVLADKPMAINTEDFELLKEAFASAEEQDVLLYDIMTERHEISTMLQRAFSMMPEVFGTLKKGSQKDPAITKESVHHFFKHVSGKPLVRPAWFFDVTQEGNGIVDVTTHLVDLVQWESFPGQIIDYKEDIEMISARRWPTKLTLQEFQKVTGLSEYPDYLQKDIVEDKALNVFSNGEINYKINDVYARVSVIWNYQAPEGTGDTHYSVMKGSKANLVIRQGAEQNFKPELYIEPAEGVEMAAFEAALEKAVEKLQTEFPGVQAEKSEKAKNQWKAVIPENLRVGHESHFAEVTQKYLEYLKEGELPAWEVPNMITKYYITTKGLEMALENEQNLTN